MGWSHALSGAAAWVALCAAGAAAGAGPHPSTVLLGAAVTAGSALLPDLDHPGSTLSRSLGWFTHTLSAATSWAADWVQDRTCGCCADPDTSGHRAGTHTAAFAVGLAAAVGAAAWWLGAAVGVPVVFVAVCAAVCGLLDRRARTGRVVLAGGLAALGSWVYGGDSWWWVGVAVGIGCLVHSLGDGLTMSGVPLLWPWRIRGCRWFPCRPPRALRFRTGGPVERWVVGPALWLVLAGSVWLLAR